MRNLNSDWDYFLIFRCKLTEHAVCRGYVNMACNQWSETYNNLHGGGGGGGGGGQGFVSLSNGLLLITWHCPQTKLSLMWTGELPVLPLYIRCTTLQLHYIYVIMSAIASQITSLTIVYSTVHSDADERKLQSSASLAFGMGINRWPVTSRTKSQ